MRKACVISITIIVGLIYYFFDPAGNSIFPKCPFYWLTGLKCPGCGSQRAIHSLLHLDFESSIKYNTLLVFSLPIIIILGYAELKRTQNPTLYLKLHNVKFIWGYFIVTIGWWIGRNIFKI